MKENKKILKTVSKSGWMPFWWGSKFNKRLSQKRLRQKRLRNNYEKEK